MSCDPGADTLAAALIARGGLRRLGCLAVAGCVLAFVLSLLLRPTPVSSPFWDGIVGNVALFACALACFARAVVGGPRRAAALWLGSGVLSFAFGNVVFVGWTQFEADPAVPSAADIAYLGIYPGAAAAVYCLMRLERRSSVGSLWLDGALGAAGAATALAAVLSPVLTGLEGDLAEILVGAAFPVADLLLVAMIVGVLSMRGLRGGSIWLWLAGGLGIFCTADVVYALRLVSDTYVVGTVLDGLWAVGIGIMVLALWRGGAAPARAPARSSAVLVVPMLATVVAVIALVLASFGSLSPVVVALATLTLGLAGARTLTAFHQVQQFSDVQRQAVTDELTGLGNRRYLFERGQQILDEAGASGRVALLMIDLDNFKEVNDALGHHAGDRLLQEIAQRLADRGGPADLLVRLGGDEFAVVLALAPGTEPTAVAERILARVDRPVLVDGVRVRVDASVGVAEQDAADTEIADLLRRADLAMYAAKGGPSRVALYDPQLDDDNRARLEIMHDLDAAFDDRQFVLHYQPKLDLRTGAVVGGEALIRWQHPSRGLLFPDAFLAIVEQRGLMSALTRQVLRLAVEAVASWRHADMDITIAVNLSASDLLDAHLGERIAELLEMHDVPVGALVLEITESVLMTDPDRARQVLDGLRARGLRIAVDDYGTGYCSLAYLRDLPIDELKIDRSFIAQLTADDRSGAIVRSTVELAHALALEVVAEGIEDQPALDSLRAFGCDLAQGYLFSRPLPAEQFVAWTLQHRRDAVGASPVAWPDGTPWMATSRAIARLDA